MTELTIENKKYLLISEERYQELQETATLKHIPKKTFLLLSKSSQQKVN